MNVFKYLNKVYGPFSVDLFASNLTKKANKFYTKYFCEGTAGVDAFTYDWELECCWVMPPPTLIARTIDHMKTCKAHGIMVIPKWMSSAYWPIIHDVEQYAWGIQLVSEYKNPKQFVTACQFGNNIFTEGQFASNVVVLAVDFRQRL